jgi:hypothetical protein
MEGRTMARYINSFHKTHDGFSGPAVFETEAKPVEYLGFKIYRRLPECFDVVRNNVCIGMYAGLNGAKRAIDAGKYDAIKSEAA